MYLYARHAMGKTSIEHTGTGIREIERRREPQVEAIAVVREKNLLDGGMTPVAFNASPLPVRDIGVVIAGEDGRVRFFDSTLQREYWVRRLDAPVYSSPVVVPGSSDIIVASTGGMIVRFNLRGEAFWITSVTGGVLGTIAFSDDGSVAYVPSFEHRLTGIDTASGRELWNTGMPFSEYAFAFAYGRAIYTSPAVFRSGEVVVADHDNVVCISHEGSMLWSQKSNGIVRSSPVVVDDSVHLATTEGVAHSWSLRGDLRYSAKLDGRVDGSPTAHKGNVVFPLRGGGLVSLTASGKEKWIWKGASAFEYTSLVATEDEVILFTSDRGTICALDGETGAFLWESSQVIGRPDWSTELNTTPVPCGDGTVYAASYHGLCYRFRHPQRHIGDYT